MIFSLKFHKFFFSQKRSEQFGNKIPFHEFAQRITYFFFISYKIDLSAHAENYNAQFYLVLFVFYFFRSAKMMPSSPMLGRRSGTNSPKMDRLDFVKDSVIGELATRIGKPIPEFNKNKRGK